ncbi:hypothetical protein D3C78_1285740 [compost metagenome]
MRYIWIFLIFGENRIVLCNVTLRIQNTGFLLTLGILNERLRFTARLRYAVVLVFGSIVDLCVLLLARIRNLTERLRDLPAWRLNILELDINNLDARVVFSLKLDQLLANLVLDNCFSISNRVIQLLRADYSTDR